MAGMTVIVKTVTRWTAALIFLYGTYLVAYGHLGPGGGFAGGVILACAYVIVMLAYGKEEAQRDMPHSVISRLDSLGALAFLLLALVGLIFFNGFFFDWLHKTCPGEDYRLFSAGMIPLANIAIAVKVFSALFLVFSILATIRGLRAENRTEFKSDEVD